MTVHANKNQSLFVCLYHDKKWRSSFQFFVNQVRDTIIPAQYTFKFQHLVCVCNQTHKEWLPGDANKIIKHFHTNNLSKKQVSFLERLFASDLWNRDQPQESCLSAKQLVYLLSAALNKDFSLLKPSEPCVQPAKAIAEFKFSVKDFMPLNIGLMIGKKGKNIHPIEKKYQCTIKLGATFEQSQACWAKSTINVKLTYPIEQVSTLPEVVRVLEKEANRIAAEREVYRQRTQEFYKRKAQRLENQRRKGTLGINASFQSPKQMNKLMYAKRKAGDLKHFTFKEETVSKLEGSRCLNCGSHYTKELFKQVHCKYHPGFVAWNPIQRVSYWTCCKAEKLEGHLVEHTQHGCTVGLHNWRPDRRNPCRSRMKDVVSTLRHITA